MAEAEQKKCFLLGGFVDYDPERFGRNDKGRKESRYSQILPSSHIAFLTASTTLRGPAGLSVHTAAVRRENCGSRTREFWQANGYRDQSTGGYNLDPFLKDCNRAQERLSVRQPNERI